MFRCINYLHCFAFVFLSTSFLKGQTDTNYLTKYYTKLVPRLVTNYKNQTTNFITRTDTSYAADYFSTGGQNFIGVEASYRWITLSYNFGFNKENSSTNTDLRVSTSYKPLRMQAYFANLKNLDYYGVEGMKQQDTIFNGRQHNITLQNVGLKLDYVFNYKKVYYSASIAQFGQQLKSKGSFILSTGISLQDFDLRGLSDSGSGFRQRYKADRFKTTRFDFGLGYAYNWVVTKRIVIYLSDIPNLGIQQIESSTQSYSDFHSTLSLTNYLRVGAIYSWKRFFVGTYVYNSLTGSKWSNFNYNNVYTSMQLHFGMLLDDPKNYFRKK